jgi:hypothetical protein
MIERSSTNTRLLKESISSIPWEIPLFCPITVRWHRSGFKNTLNNVGDRTVGSLLIWTINSLSVMDCWYGFWLINQLLTHHRVINQLLIDESLQMIVDKMWKLTNVVRVGLASRSSHDQRQTTFPDNVFLFPPCHGVSLWNFDYFLFFLKFVLKTKKDAR